MQQADYASNFRNWEVLQGWFTDLKKTKWAVSPNVRNLKADYPINDYDASSVQIHNYNAVGGSTIHFGAHFPRFHPSDFKVKSLDGVADDWPIDYQQLEPYYNLNDRIIGVSGLEGNPAYPPKKSHLPPLPVGKKGDVIAKGFNKLGWHWWPSDSAIISQPYEGRDKCINLSTCISGCTQGAKSSADVTYWPLALRRKGVELKTNCRVREITINKQGMADGVVYYDGEGRENRQKAEVVILACSAIGSPRILLNSTSQMFPNGLSARI
jgi:choline dehydrogenase-like flavoprotein